MKSLDRRESRAGETDRIISRTLSANGARKDSRDQT